MNDEIATSQDPMNDSHQRDGCSAKQQLHDAERVRSEKPDGFEVPPNLIPADCEFITPEMLTLVELDQQQIDSIVRTVPGGARNVQDIYPLSPLQEGLLFHHLLSQQSDAYILSTLFELQSRAHLDELIDALQKVIDRHDTLRTAVLWSSLPRALQVVYRRAELPVGEVLLAQDRDPVSQLKEHLVPLGQRLELRKAPLVRLEVAANPNGTEWYAVLRVHHLLCDYQSLNILVTEAISCTNGDEHRLPSPLAFRQYVAQILANTRARESEDHFRQKLHDVEEPTAPFGLLDVHGDGARIEQAQQSLDPALTQQIRIQAGRLSVSAARLFHAAWGLVVARTTGRDDVVFGTVLLAAQHRSTQARRMLGMSVNTLPLRLRLQGITAGELVEQTHRELTELLTHEETSLAIVQRCSGVSERTPLFTAILNYRHSAIDQNSDRAGASGIRVLASGEAWTNYPVTMTVDDFGESFVLTAHTDRRISPHRMTEYLHAAIRSLADALKHAPQTLVSALSVLPQGEWHQLIESFNDTAIAYPRDKVVHELFEEQVARTPDAIAVEYEKQSLTYDQLNRKANKLAQYLLKQGTGPERLVGIWAERSMELVVALLAVLKAGGAYIPLDPSYPSERLQYMLKDAAPAMVLTHQNVTIPLTSTDTQWLALNTKLGEITESLEENIPKSGLNLTARNLVYVIYTSGSTGQPKGIAMSHRSMVNLIEWHRISFPASEGKRVLQFASLSFDVAFQEIFSALCTGATLVLLDEWIRRDPRALLEFLSSSAIDRLFIPPLMLQALAAYATTTSAIPRSLQDVITAGEQLHIVPEVSSFFKRLNGSRLHNHYGPTETHVVTALTLSADAENWPALPSIGQPIANTRIYVLGSEQQPVPIGVQGEIYIGGVGVAREYLHRSDLTAQRFIADPFCGDTSTRLYKTGDLGRWHSNGTLEYLGRNDDQVKVRGYRIELGEIETRLMRHEQIREALVIAREDMTGRKFIVAYVIPTEHKFPGVEELRKYMTALLPEYMVPSAFVVMDRFPLTPNGKLNKKALPMPGFADYAIQQYEPPQGSVENILARIWEEVLEVKRVGRHDNFFLLGGHSILVMQMVVRAQRQLDLEIPMSAIFRFPTLTELSVQVQRLHRSHLSEDVPTGESADAELLEKVVSMPESEVRELLKGLHREGRHE